MESKLDPLTAASRGCLLPPPPLSLLPKRSSSSSNSSLSGASSSCGGGSDGDIFQKINAILDNKLDLGNFLARQDQGGGGGHHVPGGPDPLGLARTSSSSLSPNSSVFYPSSAFGFAAPSRENSGGGGGHNLFGLNNFGSTGSASATPGSVRTLQCGEFKFPDVSSPLSKILARNRANSSRPGSNGDFDASLGLQHAFGGLASPNGGSHFYRNSGYSSDSSSGGRAEGGNGQGLANLPPGLTPMNGGHRSESPQSESGYGTSYGSASVHHNANNGISADDQSFHNLLKNLSIGEQASPPPRQASMDGRFICGGSTGRMPPLREMDSPLGSVPRNYQHQPAMMQNFHNLNHSMNGGSGGPAASASALQSFHPNQGQTPGGNFAGSGFDIMPSVGLGGLGPVGFDSDVTALEKAAKQHRNGTAMYDASCTWSGQLPPRNMRNSVLSCKVFLGGVPWDITEASLNNSFKPFGPIRIEWPGKENTSIPKGYLYVIFETEKQVKALLSACTHDFGSGGSWYFKISSRRMRNKEVQVIPWVISDSNFVRVASSRLDPQKTVFVGALHGMLTAEGLCNIFNDLFGGVVYAGVDTDKYKYPIGSGRVTFNNNRSYMKAVAAAFIEIKTTKFTKKVQVDPYLEDALCSACGLRQGPYFCREACCFNYFCRNCWEMHHSDLLRGGHKPLMRNSKGAANAAAATGGGLGTFCRPQQQQLLGSPSSHRQYGGGSSNSHGQSAFASAGHPPGFAFD